MNFGAYYLDEMNQTSLVNFNDITIRNYWSFACKSSPSLSLNHVSDSIGGCLYCETGENYNAIRKNYNEISRH